MADERLPRTNNKGHDKQRIPNALKRGLVAVSPVLKQHTALDAAKPVLDIAIPNIGEGSDKPELIDEMRNREIQEATFQNAEMLDEMRAEAARKQTYVASKAALEASPEGKAAIINAAPVTEAVGRRLKQTDIGASLDRAEENRENGKPASPKDGFMSAMALFLPTLIGGLAGAALEGSAGLAAGLQGGMQGTKAVQEMRKTEAEINKLEKGTAISPLEQQRLDMQKANLGLRKEEIDLSRRRAKESEMEHDERRADYRTDRARKDVQFLSKRKDVQEFRSDVEQLKNIENVVTLGENMPGVAPALIARTISKEVGTLNEGDIKRTGVHPDVISSIKRNLSLWIKGKLPERDRAEIVKVVKVLAAKRKERFQAKMDKEIPEKAKFHKDSKDKELFINNAYAEVGLKRPGSKEVVKTASGETRRQKLNRLEAEKKQREQGG